MYLVLFGFVRYNLIDSSILGPTGANEFEGTSCFGVLFKIILDLCACNPREKQVSLVLCR